MRVTTRWAVLVVVGSIGVFAARCGPNQCPDGQQWDGKQCGAVQAGLPPGRDCGSRVERCRVGPDFQSAIFDVVSTEAPAPGKPLPAMITVKVVATDANRQKCVGMAGDVSVPNQPYTVTLPFDAGGLAAYPDLVSRLNAPCDVRAVVITAFPTATGISCGCNLVRVVR